MKYYVWKGFYYTDDYISPFFIQEHAHSVSEARKQALAVCALRLEKEKGAYAQQILRAVRDYITEQKPKPYARIQDVIIMPPIKRR